MTSDYLPIDCDQHSVLELLAMRQARVDLRARGGDGTDLRLSGLVFDVLTRSGAEFLLLRDEEGKVHSVRLDRLLALHAPDGKAIWCQKNVSS